MMKTNSISKNLIHFSYFGTNPLFAYIFPFRVGDIVKLEDLGAQYFTYYAAERFFFKNISETKFDSWQELKNIEFKIIGIAEHVVKNGLVVALIDRLNRTALVNARGLKVIKQFPLRKEEKTTIHVTTLTRY